MKNEMKEEVKMAVKAQAAEAKKDAEGQSVWKWVCLDCGCVYYDTRIAAYCPRCSSPRTRHI